MKFYEGIGLTMTASEWANALGLPRQTVYNCLKRGTTPEEIIQRRGINRADVKRPARKARDGHRLKETYDYMRMLLDESGYDPDGLAVTTGQGAYRHWVVWNNLEIGRYNPENDMLWLNGGEKMRLKSPIADGVTIQHKDGIWSLTDQAKQAIRDKWRRKP